MNTMNLVKLLLFLPYLSL